MTKTRHMLNMTSAYKIQYPAGTRVLLNSMADPSPVPSGTRGTVRFVDDIGTVHVAWDNGRMLGLVPRVDSFRKLSAQELAEEQAKPELSAQIKAASNRTTDKPFFSPGKEIEPEVLPK